MFKDLNRCQNVLRVKRKVGILCLQRMLLGQRLEELGTSTNNITLLAKFCGTFYHEKLPHIVRFRISEEQKKLLERKKSIQVYKGGSKRKNLVLIFLNQLNYPLTNAN